MQRLRAVPGPTNSVPGEGNPDADIMFIGEGPGFYEDQQGRPFVGASGKFLDELLRWIGLDRKTVFIANVVKCRPPQNRDPQPDEIAACAKYLDAQIAAIAPKVIVTLGRHSMQRYFPGEAVSRIHGQPRRKDDLIVVPMYHPAAALHQGSLRKVIEADFSRLPEFLRKTLGGEAITARRRDRASAPARPAPRAEHRRPPHRPRPHNKKPSRSRCGCCKGAHGRHSPLRIIPLGGLGEIGKNMMLFEYGDDVIAIDCGLMFPTEDMLGVDLVIPDVSYILESRKNLRAIFITHGHEDHTGALPYILRQINVPVYCTPLAHGLISVKLKEARLLQSTDLREIRAGRFGHRRAVHDEPFQVAHSIPDSVGYAIRTPVGTCIHTGDFKLDHTPVMGQSTDLARLAQLGDEGVLLLCADSTYAEVPGLHAVRADRGRGDLPAHGEGDGARHRDDVRVADRARAAGVRRGRSDGAARVHHRPQHDRQRQHGDRARLPARAGGHAGERARAAERSRTRSS